ncbi:MAG: TraR/DksA family transcriptional regulator [Candidatus Binatia bacterium]
MDPRERRLSEMLTQRRDRLASELRREFGSRLEDDALTSQDEKIEVGDRSVSVLSQDVELTRLEIKRRELRRIDEALARLARGVYGICQDCEAAVDEARLETLPFATRCVECERRRELEEKQSEAAGIGFRAEFHDLAEDGEGED